MAAGAPEMLDPTVFRQADVDGDGQQDEMLDTRSGCIVARHAQGGWVAVLSLELASDTARCGEPTQIGRETVLTTTAFGHETDHDNGRTTSESWNNIGLYVARPGRRLLKVFETRVDEEHGILGDWSYEPSPDGASLVVIDHTPSGTTGDAATAQRYALLAWNTDHTALAQASCWQSSRPVAPRRAIAGCTARPGFALTTEAHEDQGREGVELPAGTALRVVNADSVTRGATRLHCVQTADGAYRRACVSEPHGAHRLQPPIP